MFFNPTGVKISIFSQQIFKKSRELNKSQFNRFVKFDNEVNITSFSRGSCCVRTKESNIF